ncbi:hypothetical protein [Microbacterium capsulatum]|uniref:Uncharacterized protein n=1 Tax=Microbacterium capsulatum TaxID=3041921 RepID=A0ABU0XBJ4_9MICO|nr:hypothetical protein [Microbacterium sp. ASV81]MDQ4212466.1 hypothetical protein [Microbacterium sp. ASV81]
MVKTKQELEEHRRQRRMLIDAPEEFWNARPVLAAIRANAIRTLTAPEALLGAVLMRALAVVPWEVTYRSSVGVRTSLNAAAVLCGKSGGGKTMLESAAREAVTFPEEPRGFSAVRSGEAVVATLVGWQKGEDKRPYPGWLHEDHAVRVYFDEVGKLAQLGGRQGSTILEYLKEGVSGSDLGGQRSDGTGLTAAAGEYRATFTVAAQPERAEVLLNEDAVAGGLPGRFLWFWLHTDERLPDDLTPVEPFAVPSVAWEFALDDVPEVVALPEMDAEHREHKHRANRGDVSAIDGHSLLVRVKVAVALMVLDGRAALTSEDWILANAVMGHSDRTRERMQQAETDRARRATERQADLAVALEDRAERRKEQTVLDRMEVLMKGGLTFPQAQQRLNGNQKTILRDLVARGMVTA